MEMSDSLSQLLRTTISFKRYGYAFKQDKDLEKELGLTSREFAFRVYDQKEETYFGYIVHLDNKLIKFTKEDDKKEYPVQNFDELDSIIVGE